MLNDKRMDIIHKKLDELSHSKFRSRFHLNDQMISYLDSKGYRKIKEHGLQFIQEKLVPAYPKNDGKQTPMKGHPIFIAQHACACCCRGCLEKWHHIKKGRELTNNEINYIISLLMEWIVQEKKNH